MVRPLAAIAHHPIWTGIGVTVLAAIVTLALVWDWNWFRPLVARTIADELQRPVTLQHFDVRDALSAQPLLVFDGIAIGNPPGFPAGSETGTIQKLSVRFDLPALLASFGHNVIVSQIAIDRPQGDLRPGPNGNPNWMFAMSANPSSPSPLPRIGSLVITDGDFRFAEPKRGADVRAKVQTVPGKNGGEPQIVITANGTYGGQKFAGTFRGGSLLTLKDKKKPYPVEVDARAGNNKIHLVGTLQDPETLGGADLQLELEGQDLAELYPIFHVPLAPSPPFHLRGHLDYSGTHIRFHDFSGTVGQSDLEGNFDVDRGYARPLVTADLTSKSVRLADLAGFIGATPGKAGAPTEGPKQRAEHAAAEAKSTLLPNTAIDLQKIRSTDFRVHYRGERILTDWAPLDHLETNLSITDGDIRLTPLDFAVGTGNIYANIELDGRVNPIRSKVDIDFRQVDFHRIMQSTKIFGGVGTIGGRWELDGRGNSLAQILAHSNGDLRLFMGNGNLSAILVNLAGLDIGGTIASLLGLPQQANINCMVSDFALRNGVLDTKALVLDTDQANVFGKGTVDLRNETIDFQVTQEGKHVSVGALHAPIDITGKFKSPSVKPDPAALGIRLGIAAALGAVFPPAALLPTIQLGLGTNHNCGALIAAAQAGEAPHQLPQSAPHVAGTPAPKQQVQAPRR
ncbi:MAG TPA: AsmA family protein [Stellaceae bacterium]|nr:AsmA family protein [Stellaceae bacterium]